MKTNTGFFGTILLITFTSILDLGASQIDGIWISQDRVIIIEIENYDLGIRVRQQNRGWDVYRRKGNRFESSYGSFCRLINNHTIEWYDRGSRIRYMLHKDNDYGRVRNGSRYNDRYSGRYPGSELRNLEGKWFNESTGQHIHIKTRRDRIRIKFHGERWVEFVQGRNGRFIDEYGNRWQIYRDIMIFESFNRDLIMEFTKGAYQGRRHRNYFNFR